MTGILTFLGTGTSQGVPLLACQCEVCLSTDPKDKRLRTSALIAIGNRKICIDSGPDFRMQMLREGISDLDAIVFTHAHRDHISGLDDVRAYNYKHDRAMPIYAEAEVIHAIKSNFSYIFESDYPGIPKLDIREITDAPFEIFEIPFQPIPVMHLELLVFGYRVGNLAYITDAKTVPYASKKGLAQLDTLIINCLHEPSHVSHFNLEEALAFIAEIKPKRTYLTHMSHLFGKHPDILAKLPANVFPAYDGLQINFEL